MVKIVSFLWYFTLWTFLFFFFCTGSHGPFIVQFMLSGTSVPCWHELLVQFRLGELWQCCFAELLYGDTLLTPWSLQSSLKSTLAEGKSLERVRFTPASLFFIFFQEPFSGCCLSHQPLQGGSYPLGLGAGGRSFGAPAHWMGQEIWYFYKKEKQVFMGKMRNSCATSLLLKTKH